MKLTISQSELNSLIKTVLPAVNKKEVASHPACSNKILIEVFKDCLVLTGNDLTVSIKAVAQASVEETGACGVHGKMFADLIDLYPTGDLTLSLSFTDGNSRLKIKSGRKVLHLNVTSPESFPVNPRYETFKFFDAGKFFTTVEMVGHCVSSDETRVNLMGVSVSKNRMVATNGYVLALHPYTFIPEAEDILIPYEGLSRVKNSFDDNNLGVCIVNNIIHLQQGNKAASIRLTARDFPKIDSVIPKSPYNEAIIKKDDLIKSLKILSVMAIGKNREAKFRFSNNNLQIFSESVENGSVEENIECTCSHEDVIGLNVAFVMSLIKKIKGDTVVMQLRKGSYPVVILEGEYMQLVMPVKV